MTMLDPHIYSVHANIKELAGIRAFVNHRLLSVGVESTIAQTLCLAVDEACSNIILHGHHHPGSCLKISVDYANGIWVTQNGVLYKFNGTDFNFVAQGTDKLLKTYGDLIYVAGFDSFMIYTIDGTFFNNFFTNNSCLAGIQLNALDIDSSNKTWIAFQGNGIQNFTDCVTYNTTNSGLPDNFFSTLRTQSNGVIWAGTLQLGLVKMTPSSTTCNPPTNFSSTNITSSTATINWTAATPAPTNYVYLYNTTPTVGGTNGSTVSTSD